MEAELSELAILLALNTCVDSAPGLDWIPYCSYKKLWSIEGFIIWIHGNIVA
jgi:hypothetical protein